MQNLRQFDLPGSSCVDFQRTFGRRWKFCVNPLLEQQIGPSLGRIVALFLAVRYASFRDARRASTPHKRMLRSLLLR
jgi:hypothetical protein